MRATLLDLYKAIFSTGARQSLFDPCHDGQHFLLLKPLAHHLHSDRQSMHFVSIVMLVCALRNTIQAFEVECPRKLIEGLINVRYWYDTTGVIKLCLHQHTQKIASLEDGLPG